MIIKKLHIDGFGIFSDFSLLLPGKGLHIILGENEAGKSTLLKFLSYTLYGYPKKIAERMPPLKGGNHGGRIEAELSAGSPVVFDRAGTDKIRLVHNNHESANANQWIQLLGNAQASLYNNVYCFTLDELVSMASLHDSGMEDRIFSLGLGLGNISLSAIDNQIRSEVEKIYTPSGRKRIIQLLATELQTTKQEINEIQQHLSAWQTITAEIEDLGQRIETLEKDHLQLQQQQATLQNHMRCYDSYVSLRRAENELNQMPWQGSLPEKGEQHMEKALEQKALLTQKVAQLINGSKGQQGIEEIEQLLESIEINASLLQESEKIEYIRLNLATWKQTLKERDEEGRQLQELEKNIAGTIKSKIGSKWNEPEVLAFRDAGGYMGRIEKFEKGYQRVTEELRSWEAQEKVVMSQKGSFNTKAIAIIMSLVFVMGSVPFFYYTLPLAGFIMLVIAVLLISTRSYFKKSDPVAPIRKKIKELAEAERELIKTWGQWLQNQLKLSPDLTFSVLPGIFQSIEQVKGLLVQRDRLRKKIQEERLPWLMDFEAKVKSLSDLTVKGEGQTEVEIVAKIIISEYDENKQLFNQCQELSQSLNRLQKERELSESQLVEAETTISGLLSTAKADDTEAFYAMYAAARKRAELDLICKNALEKIETVAGLNKAEEVLAYLDAIEKSAMESELSEMANRSKGMAEEIALLNREKGAKEGEKERLANESDLAEKMTELETLKEKIREAWKQWLTGQLALKMLGDVRAGFEKEKQPLVIRRAGEHFKAITGGVWEGIRVSLEGNHVSVFNNRQESRSLNQLSRGTREQLLLSLRLGFIEEYERQSEPLPIIVDEILVNFDPVRARKTAEILLSFAQTRQILFFTCHPGTLELFQPGKANVIKLSSISS